VSDTPDVMVDQDVADKLYGVIYDDNSTPAQIWDAINDARGPAIDAADKGCNDGTYIGIAGVTHFGTAIVGHLYHSTILDRVSQILSNDSQPYWERVGDAVELIDDSFAVVEDRMAKLTQERAERIGRY
jgi:hypothetical protein